MLKPPMPNIPGVGAVTDTLDFVKNLWGSMSVPGISLPGLVAPTMSVDELDKKIADLKAVDAWLNVNGAMLRATIQALEIQRGTIATLKSMGAALASAVKQPGADEKSVLAAAPYASAFFAQPTPLEAVTPPAPQAIEAAPASAPNDAASGLASPNLWWNMLQDQFKQAVSTAMSSDVAGKLAAAASRPSAETGMGASAAAAKGEATKAPAKKRAAAKPKSL